MVRETRYLWIGNLPHTIREERILEHFKRYGKVQSVKILPKKEEDNGASATVAFIDIKSASKAHNADNKIDDRTLKTDYYEPPASSTASSAIYIHERDDALVRPAPASYTAGRTPRYGLSEERNYERPGHYYADREPYIRRQIGIGYHDEDNYQGRAKSRDRYSRSAPGNNYTEGAERNQNHFRPHNARQHFDQQRYPVGDQYSEEREPAASSTRLSRRTNNAPVTPTIASVASPTIRTTENRSRRTKRRSPSRTPSGSRSNSGSRSRSRSSSDSRSSSSSSKLRSSSSDSSGRSRSPSKSRSPVSALYSSQNNTKGNRLDRPSSAIANPSSTPCYLPSAVNASAINCTSNNTQSSTPSQGCTLAVVENHCDREEKRPLGICVRNLPVRSTDTSLKDGLFHEYKKHGKVTMVKVIGQGTDRYAVVCFKKPEDVDKALEVSKDKLFFGCKIEVTAHEGLDAEDNEFRPLEAELDEFHPKATRTLFIGNLEKDITTPELRNHFEQFGEIIEIDIKKQGSATSYAFIQYSDIASVVKAMRKLDGENLGANRIKLGFGKSMPTNCVWLDGIVDTVSDKFLSRHFSRFGIVAYTIVDREKGHALVFYENVEFAQIAVSEMRGRILQGKKLQVDFASRECQTTFFDKLEMTGQMIPGDGRPWERRERRGPEFEVVRSDDREPRVGFENRVYPRYEAQSRPPRGNFRGGQRAGFSSRGRGQGFSARYETYHDEFGERRHRYNSREDSIPEVTLFDSKAERPKYPETPECPNRKRNKLRNSISDQESHHSQSPPRSSHQSRSTSPVSVKDSRKSTKERSHHRVKSPGSQNSSLVNSPCRDVSDEMETDYRDCRSKGDEGDLPYASPANTSPRSTDKESLLKGETDSLRSDADSGDESASDQLGRKKRFLGCSSLPPKGGAKEPAKSTVSEKGKLPNSHAVNSLKTGKVNCVVPSEEPMEESKCDTIDNNSTPQQQDCTKVKTDSANTTDLRYLQKKQVQLLHMLEQLGENANTSDIEALLEVERLKKHRSPSTCSETNSLLESDSLKSLTKDECGIKLCKSSGPKDPAILTKLKSKGDTIDSNNCISLSLDSYIFQKHLDPRKGCDQHSVSMASVNSLQKCRRISVDNETCLPILQGASDSFLCAPSPISDVSWRKECNSVSDHFPESGSPISSHGKIKEETISDEDTPLSKKSLDFPNRILSLRTLSDIRHEVKRDISPLSLPLPKFAASLRSPKSSPNVVTSPKSTSAHSPRAGHSPSSYVSSKSARISDLPDKAKDSPDDKVNGASVSPVDSISPFEPQPMETEEPVSSMEPIQSPKSNCEKVKESHSSSESEMSPSASPNRPSIEDRIKALDEKFNAWSGSSRNTVATPDAVAPVSAVPEVPKCPVKRSRFNYLAPEIRSEPSEIVKSILARPTIFDQDTKRLQHIDEKYEPVNVVKMDSPPKAKPTFRTKAAAKEFSIPIAPAPQPLNQSSLVKTPSTILVAQSIMSPPSTHQSGSGSVLAPVTPPVQQFNSQLTPQAFAPCSPCVATPYGVVSSTIKSSEGLSIVEKDFGDHVLKTAVFNSVKIKSEPGFHMNSSALATSLKSPLHCPVEVTPHTMVVSSPNIKREPASPTDSVTESVCKFEIECKVPIKKEVAVHNITSIPLKKDGCVSLTKDHLHLNSFDNDKKEFCDSKDPRLSFHESSSHWRENGCKDDIKPNIDSCAKSFTNNPEVPVNSLGPATKKRVSSIDSTESESSKSVKSLDSSRDSHEINWSKHEKTSEPEPKKPKLCKSATQDRSSSPPLQAAHSKKTEKKEKSSKPEKSKTSASKSGSSSSNTEKSKSSKSEYKEKMKSEHKSKEEKRSKSRDSKESSSKDQRTKSRERRNSEKDNKGSNPSKSKKETHSTKSESKHEMKGDEKEEKKHESKGDRHESKGESRHEGKGDSRHESKGDRHESKGDSRHESKGDRHEAKGDSRHESKGDRHDNKVDSRHESKGDGRHEAKGDSRHESKGESRHESKSDRHDRNESRHESKNERHEGKQENKGEGKHESKSDRSESKHDRSESKKDRHESRHENKYESKHDLKYEGRHKGRSESKYESKSESKNNSDNESKSEDTKSEKKQSDKKSKKSSSSSLPFDFQAFMDDAPVYFSMYDKVKARSSKSQTLKHQTSDLESVRQKFSKLKQSRAKREKTKSIEDSDKDSDSGSHHSSESDSQAKSTKLKQPRKRKLVIESSSDDGAVSHDSSSRISKMEKDFNDSATDSDFEYNVSRRQSGSLKVRKKKTDILNSDTSDSDSNFASKSQPSKKKSMSNRSKLRPDKSRKIIRSDYEMSDVEIQQHKPKEKDPKTKKVKREKIAEFKQESESMDCDVPPKKTASEDPKAYKKKSFKDIKQEPEIPSQKKVKAEHSSKEKQSSKEKKVVESVIEKMQVDDSDKHSRSFSKKRKKSKKMSKNKEKRSSSDKGESSRKQEDSDVRLSLPVLSPKPSNPLPEKQQSPPYLQAGVFSDDYKSDFSDFDFEPNRNDDAELNSDIWKQMDTKSDTNSEKSSKSKKKDSSSKMQSSVIQSPEQDSSLPSFFDKLSDITDSETCREPADCGNDGDSKHHDFPLKKDKESTALSSPHKSKHDKPEEQSSRQESNRHSDSHLSSKEERRKKKSKKQSKEKKKKREDKENPQASKDSTITTTSSSSVVMPPSPKPLFEPLAMDEDSRLSDLQLGEATLDESRPFEQEYVVVTPETSTFDEEEPAKREEKHVERRFEEEAAKETRRLEAELFSTGRDSWHMKEKDYDQEASPGELCEEKQSVDLDSLTSKEESIFTGLDLHSSIAEPSQSEGDVFMPGQSESDPFQMDDKDVNEIEDQRKIEDDLAVSALLQEMQCCEIPAPELTKETDYLDPLIETHPEDTMNYLLPDDGENSLHIAEGSPEGPVIDSQEEKLESSIMLLSPTSNSEPPALELSTVEDSTVLKAENSNQSLAVAPVIKEKQPCETEVIVRKSTSCYDFHEDSLEMCESKPPVIDIPVIPENLEASRTLISPKTDPLKIQKLPKEIREKPHAPVKTDSNEDTDNESGSELAENQLTHFEDITMDTTDSKDNDNPPILIPVESPRNRLPVSEPKDKMEPPAMVIPAEEKHAPCEISAPNIPEPEIPTVHVNEFDKLSIDLDEKFDQLVNHLEQSKAESKPSHPISDELCTANLHISDLSDQNSTDSLLINNNGLFNNNDETRVIKPFTKFQENSSLNITKDFEKETNIKYNLPEPINTTIDPPMLHYSDILNSSSEKATNKSPKVDHDNDTLSLPEKNIQNLEPFVSEGADTSAITNTNQASTDSFLLDLFGPRSVENEKIDTYLYSEKLNTQDDLIDSADSKNKIEDSDVSSADNQSCQADTFEISEVNEQNEATEFNQEIFERASDNKDSKVPQLLSFSSEQLFTDLTNKLTEENSHSDTHMNFSYEDTLPKTDDGDKSDDDKLVIEEAKTVDPDKLFESEAKIDEKSIDMSTDEHLSFEDSLDIKARPADAESVSSDTTDITIPETKGESEANPASISEEPMPEEPAVEDIEISAKPKLERPRRGRRPKTRKYAEPALQKSEVIPEPVTTFTSTRSSSRRARPTSSERPRRSLRSDHVETVSLREYGKKRHSVDDSIHSETEETKRDVSGEVSDGLVSDATAEGDSIAPCSSTDSLDQKSADKHSTKSEEPRRRRGRRKKVSNDSAPAPIEKVESKPEESEFAKEYHRPKEPLSWFSLMSTEKEQKPSKENNPSSAYDVFEFTEDDESENLPFESVKERLHDTARSCSTESKHVKVLDPKHDKIDLKHDRTEIKHERTDSKHDLRVSDQKHDRLPEQKVKDRPHEPIRSVISTTDSKHVKVMDKAADLKHERASDQKHDKVSENIHEKEKKPDETSKTSEDRDVQVKEPHPEKEHKKISIIIRLNHNHDGSSPGTATAEVVQTSEATTIEEPKIESSKLDKTSVKSDISGTDAPHTGPSKSTRKSTRLMNQAQKSTLDEVIEDVVKGHLKDSSDSALSETTPTRGVMTRRSRSNRKSEENLSRDTSFDNLDESGDDKNKNEPVFFIHDDTSSRDVPQKDKKKHSIDSTSTSSSNPESDKNPPKSTLRAFRITRSIASKLESSKDLADSIVPSNDQETKKKETSSSNEKVELKVQKEPKEPKSVSESAVVNPPLPVLKVEINRIEAKKIRVEVPKREPPQPEKLPENEDSNSTSSTGVLLDPATGILTSVDKSDHFSSEPTKPSSENKNTPTPDIPISVVNIKSISEALPETVTATATSVIQEGSKSSSFSSKTETRPPWAQNLRSRRNSNPLAPTTTDPTPIVEVPPTKLPTNSEPAMKLPIRKAPVAVLSVLAIADSLASNAAAAAAAAAANTEPTHYPETSVPSPVVGEQASRGQSPVITSRTLPPISSPAPATVLAHDKKSDILHQSKVPPSPIPAHGYDSNSRTPPVSLGHITSIPSGAQSKSLTTSAVTCITSTKSELPIANTPPIIPPVGKHHPSSVSSCKPLSLTTTVDHSNIKQEVASLPSPSLHDSTWSGSKSADSHIHVSTIQSNTTSTSAHTVKSEGRSAQPAHCGGKSNSAFTQQTGYLPNYDDKIPGAHGLSSSAAGGVIAELLQQPKEYFSASQLQQERNFQMVRPATPNIPSEIVARTPPPPTSTPDIHSLHIRHPSNPSGLVVLPPNVHHQEMTFMHQQMIYAAALHGAQQQARAAALGRFRYPSLPPSPIVSNNSFKQPGDHMQVMMDPTKADLVGDPAKMMVETTKDRGAEEKSSRSRSMRNKKEKMMQQHPEDAVEAGRLMAAHEKMPTNPAAMSMRQLQPAHFSSQILQMGPHLSGLERITDSPGVANLCTAGSGRVPPQISLPGQGDEHKASEGGLGSHSSHINEKPRKAHQSQPSTNLYLDAHSRQQLLSVPQIGTGLLDGRSQAPAHSPSARSHAMAPPIHNAPGADKCVVPPEHSKKVFNTRPIVHQGSSISPGPVGLPPPAGSPWPAVISHTSHQPITQSPHMMLTGSEQSHRRGNTHLSSQMRADAVSMQGPPPAHAMSQASVPRSITSTPPQGGPLSSAPCDQFLFQVSYRYPVMWQGLLALKNDQAAVQMHFVSGNPNIARASLPPIVDGEAAPVRIAQRMRLEHLQLEGVKKKIQMEDEHCVLMALPCGKDHMDVLQQSSNLKNGFINYLLLKQAAGIVNAAPPGCQQPAYVIHIFPSCEFTDTNLARIAPDLLQIICEITHLVIVIATV